MAIAPTTTRVAGAGGLTLAVHARGAPGASRSTVVLVHGYPDTSAVWDPVAERLAADGFHVVAPDVRGSGASDAPATTDGYRIERLNEDLAAVIDATAAGRPVHLVGHDGGSIQCWPALGGDALGGRLVSFTSISGPGFDEAGAWMAGLRRTRSVRALRLLAGQLRRSWYIAAFQLPGLAPWAWSGPVGRRWPAALHRMEGAVADDRWPAPTLRADAARQVGLYRANRHRAGHPRPVAPAVPVQLLVPTRDRFVSPALVDALAAGIDDLTRHDLDGGHWVVRTDPDAVADRIAAFARLHDG
jgi:pimeloyl-ACP methyl ester carboxylesterase